MMNLLKVPKSDLATLPETEKLDGPTVKLMADGKVLISKDVKREDEGNSVSIDMSKVHIKHGA